MIDENKLIEELKKSNYHHASNSREEALLDRTIRIVQEQPKVENSLGFKHFKLHADSTLKGMTKDELISYIHMLYHNWSVADERAENVMRYAEKLQKLNECKPYEFNDLKDGVWVWDKNYQEVCYVASIISRERMYVEYLESHCSIEPCKIMRFTEKRFYPVQMANEVKENE